MSPTQAAAAHRRYRRKAPAVCRIQRRRFRVERAHFGQRRRLHRKQTAEQSGTDQFPHIHSPFQHSLCAAERNYAVIENGELRYPCAAFSRAAHITIKFFRRVWCPQKVNCPKGKRGHPGVPRRVNRLHIAKNCIVLPVFRISWREIAISWREMGISWRESTQSREENRRAENSTVQ